MGLLVLVEGQTGDSQNGRDWQAVMAGAWSPASGPMLVPEPIAWQASLLVGLVLTLVGVAAMDWLPASHPAPARH